MQYSGPFRLRKEILLKEMAGHTLSCLIRLGNSV